ncbi:unnamed protein product [Durusdinium trenchii]
MNHAFFRLHRRSAAVNKIKAKVPNLYESKGVYNCLEQEIWPNRKVTTYQRCFGAKARVRPQRGSFGPKGAELPSRKAEILATPGALPGAPGTPLGEDPVHVLSAAIASQKSHRSDQKSEMSPPVSELGSIPLCSIFSSMSRPSPSSPSRPSRPSSLRPKSASSASASRSRGSASASALRPKSAMPRCGASATASTPSTASTSRVCWAATSLTAGSCTPSTPRGKENQENETPETAKLEAETAQNEKPRGSDLGFVVRNRSRVRHVGWMSWIE